MINNNILFGNLKSKSLDKLLRLGFRHFGDNFFRYSHVNHEGEIATVLPLRINLNNFYLSKGLRKIKKKNESSNQILTNITLREEIIDLFESHKTKFKFGVPETIYNFLGDFPEENYPCEVLQLEVSENKKVYSVSYLDIGDESTSSVYGMYDFNFSKRSPGIYTMILEIEYSLLYNKKYYYSGYCYDIPSYYDYKKNFKGLEYLDWKDFLWKPLNEI
jgi:leucyl-tRNA---protein transferase